MQRVPNQVQPILACRGPVGAAVFLGWYRECAATGWNANRFGFKGSALQGTKAVGFARRGPQDGLQTAQDGPKTAQE
eukprot:7554106-Pyramimonas_sp.AAC.1